MPEKIPPNEQRALDLLQALRDLRSAKGWSQEKLARLLKMPSVTVSRWDRGVTKPKREATILAIESFLARNK